MPPDTQDHPAALLASPPAACEPLAAGLRIPLAMMEPSPLNPRKRWSEAKVAEMAEDLKANGQIQPIRVRPSPRYTPTNGRPPYEIVVGETRWRAAPAADLPMLDAMVGQYTDQQVIQLALAENTKRADLHPLEEADAYDALLRKPDGLQGYPSVPELAAAIGASPSHVYQRLKLRALCDAGRAAFLAGKLTASVALLIARMPSEEEQSRATARIVAGFGGEPYSYLQAAEYLRKEFMLRLDLARFDTTATYSVAGPCAACPKRSGAMPDLFPDLAGGGDMCQDARCYQAKAEEAHQALLQAARDAGCTVLQGADAKRVLPMPGAAPIGHYELDKPCPALTDSARTLRQLLSAATTRVVVDHPAAPGTVVELVTEADARKALKARGLLRNQTASGSKAAPKAQTPAPSPAPAATSSATTSANTSGAEPPPPAGAARAKGAGETEADESLRRLKREVEARRELVRDAFADLFLVGLRERVSAEPELGITALRMALGWIFGTLSAEASRLLFRVHDWAEPRPGIESWDGLFANRLATATGRQMAEWLIELLVAEDLTDDKRDPGDMTDTNAAELARVFGLSVDRVMAEALAVLPAQVGKGAGSAAGAARREPDATAAFVAAHANTPTEPADDQAGQTDEGACHANA